MIQRYSGYTACAFGTKSMNCGLYLLTLPGEERDQMWVFAITSILSACMVYIAWFIFQVYWIKKFIQSLRKKPTDILPRTERNRYLAIFCDMQVLTTVYEAVSLKATENRQYYRAAGVFSPYQKYKHF